MSLSFPLSNAALADRLPIQSVRWWLEGQEEYSSLGSGEFLAADLGPKLWKGEVGIAPMYHAAALEIQSRIEALDGSMNSFYLYDPRARYPRNDPDGTILGAATPVIASLGANNKSLTVSGLPAGYVLTAGGMFHFDYGTSPVRRALHRIVETVTANGSGVTPNFEVRPHFAPGAAVALALKFIDPSAKVRIVPRSFEPGTGQAGTRRTEGMSFQVQQTL